METLRKEILNAVGDSSEMIGGSFEQYCKIFFNRRSKENKCIMFGIKKQELLTEVFGFSFPDLIKDTVRYLVRIEASQMPEVQITFRGVATSYSSDQQEWFKALYSHYNADKTINLGLFFSQKRKIPPLTIKDDWAMEFMCNPNKNFRFLDGDNLVEKVEIKHPKVIDVPLYQSLDDVFLIPEKYSMFAEYKKTIQQDVETQKKETGGFLETFFNFGASEIEKNSQENAFWKKVSENICDVDKINFVILNHNDDFMVLSFFNLIDRYRKKYANINLLKRIFFVYDETAKTTKAASSKDLPDTTKTLFKELHNSLRKIENNDCDCALYVCALEFLESLDAKTKQKNERTIAVIKQLLFNALKKNLLK